MAFAEEILPDDRCLESSREIIDRAMLELKPHAIVAAVSGGTDSLTTLKVAQALGVKIDFLLHCRTGTGIPETTEYVRGLAEAEGLGYIEADAGDTYENYVMRKGFFGVGRRAHEFSYHTLKHEHLRGAISRHIRHRKRNRNVLILNGVRITESENRFYNFSNEVITPDDVKSNVWVNLIHYWSKRQCKEFLGDCAVEQNPVSKVLCRSGECNCGTMQQQVHREEAAYWFPAWGKWLDELEARVKERHPWEWGRPIPKGWQLEKAGQLNMFTAGSFQPMCSGCLREGEAIGLGGEDEK